VIEAADGREQLNLDPDFLVDAT